MNDRRHAWALILAAGEGSRLRTLTTNIDGVSVPKQFCSLYGGRPSLLEEATRRALHVAPVERVCSVVAAHHRQWWEVALGKFPERNVTVQPENRGTAHGILLPLMHIFARDPDAHVVVLPSDHYLRDETAFARSLQGAAGLAAAAPDAIYLLGIEPDEPDTELGYIVPTTRSDRGVSHVSKFVEKPTLSQVHNLMRQGAVWNAFIIAASIRSFIALFTKRFAATVGDMWALAAADPAAHDTALNLSQLYQRLPLMDFSRDVLEGQEGMLRVLTIPNCGWTDLGTPRRVAQTLQQWPRDCQELNHSSAGASSLSLAAQYLRSISSDGYIGDPAT
jgi:mannose-1-phosphate guanylyltransferase